MNTSLVRRMAMSGSADWKLGNANPKMEEELEK
jgi:hypothetical protein